MVDFSGASADAAGGNAQINNLVQQIVQAIRAQTQNTALIPYSTAATAGASAGLYLNITISGTPYKLALLLP